VFYSSDVITVILRLEGGTQVVNIYNVYNLPPSCYNDETGTVLIIALNNALAIPGRYIVVRDFNLYYLL
jgi:hypothetical protein